MTGMYGLQNSSISSLFSGFNGVNTTSTSSSILADYASLRNGSYKRLAKNYYRDQNNSDRKLRLKTTKEDTKKLNELRSNSKDLFEASTKLMSTNFEPKTDKEKEAAFDNIKAFVDSYNDTVKDTKDATNTSILTAASSMVKSTQANKGLLGQLGIKVNADNTLKLDESFYKDEDGKMKDVNYNPAKALFKGMGSYAQNVSSKSSYMSTSATNAASKATTYTSVGNYNKYGRDYSSLFDNMV
ncbi:MAG: hypothetical protein IJM91_00600 [Lachnospiraceae bacterium]|nr:hypothetical protein [Lachnospiraceae bacterium]